MEYVANSHPSIATAKCHLDDVCLGVACFNSHKHAIEPKDKLITSSNNARTTR